MNKYLFGLLSAICFGSIAVVGKLALLESNPQTILITRFGIVAIVMFLSLLLANQVRGLMLKKGVAGFILLLGIFQAVETSLFWFGLDNLTVIELLALFWTYPLFNLVIDISLGKIRDKVKSALLIILGIVGVFLASGGGNLLW